MSTTTTTTTYSKEDLLAQLCSLVSSSEVIHPTDPEYIENSQTWSDHHNLHPSLILRPTSLNSISKILVFLNKTDLDFKVRSQGYGNASARDVLISLTAFDQFHWDAEHKVVTLGPGARWEKYYDEMNKIAPEYAIVSARTPSIGIGGSTLASGFSWLSHERGCVSDEANMIDAQVVTLDGTIMWASEDPELMWSLRGSETGFAIVTAFKFQAFPYPENGNIYAGPIFIPRNQIPAAAEGIVSMLEKQKQGKLDRKMGIFLYVMKKELLHLVGVEGEQDVLVIHCFDGLGEMHGRETFKWALDIEGAIDMTRGNMNLREVAELQSQIGSFRGRSTTFWAPLALTSPQLSPTTIQNSLDWWSSMLAYPNSVANNNWLLFELFSCRDSLTGRHSSAWPRPEGYEHMILLGTGVDIGATEEEVRQARERLRAGPVEILGAEEAGRTSIAPNAGFEIHRAEDVYGVHYERLRGVKRRFDPGNKLKGPIKP